MSTAFVGLDYIVEITLPEGKLAGSAAQVQARGVIAKANQALLHAREQGWLSILVRVGYARGYVDLPDRSPMFRRARELGALECGSPGMAFHPELQEGLAGMRLIKPRVSAFYGTGLEAALRARRVERLVVAGVSTCWAVESTVRDAHDRDFEVLLLEDACAAASPTEHEDAVSRMARIARVISTDELLRS